MTLAAFLDGLVSVAGQDILWIIAFFTAGGVLLALYIPVLELVNWMRSKFKH
jgi:hypothetical protein